MLGKGKGGSLCLAKGGICLSEDILNNSQSTWQAHLEPRH